MMREMVHLENYKDRIYGTTQLYAGSTDPGKCTRTR